MGICFDDFQEDPCIGSGGTWNDGLNCDDVVCESVPPNDDIDNAIFISPGLHEFDTTTATSGSPFDDFTACDNAGDLMVHNDVWYAVDVPSFNFGIVFNLQHGAVQYPYCGVQPKRWLAPDDGLQ